MLNTLSRLTTLWAPDGIPAASSEEMGTPPPATPPEHGEVTPPAPSSEPSGSSDWGTGEDGHGGTVGNEATPQAGATLPGEDPAAPEPGSPLFGVTFDDGEEVNFNSTDEAKEWIRKHGLRQSSYTKKMQGVTKREAELDALKERQENEYTAFLSSQNQVSEADKLLQSMTWPQFNQFVQLVKRDQQMKNNPAYKEITSMREELDGFKSDRQKEKEASDRKTKATATYDDLELSLEGFDREKIKTGIAELNETMEGDEMRTLATLVHYANIGKMRAAEYARGITKNLQTKTGQPAPPVTTGAIPPSLPEADPNKSWNELAEEAKEELKAGTY